MLRNKRDKYLYNPAVGLFPLLLVVFLTNFVPLNDAIDISLSVCAIMSVFFLWLMGLRVFQIFFLSSLICLLFYNFAHIVLPFDLMQKYSISILEIVFLTVIIGVRTFENRLLAYVDENMKIGLKIHLKPALQIYFFISRIFIVFLILHLLLLLLLRTFFLEHISEATLMWIKGAFPIFILIVSVIEFLDISWIGKQINKERYLPIIDAGSRVIGHIALSEMETFDKKFQHPIVRILFKHGNQLYLRDRPKTWGFEVGKADLPVEDFIDYGENMEDAVKRLMQSVFGKTKLEPCFMLKYSFENRARKSLNYLYVIEVSEGKLNHLKSLKGGKWWIESQIVENLGKKYFSSAFESEFEYIQSTVLMAEKY